MSAKSRAFHSQQIRDAVTRQRILDQISDIESAYRTRTPQAEEARTEKHHAETTGEADQWRRASGGFVHVDDQPTVRELGEDR